MRLLLVASAAIALFLTSCATGPTPEELRSASFGAAPDLYEEPVKHYLSRMLIDPYSARYTFDVEPMQGWYRVAGEFRYGYYVCGTVNAKNRLGAYVGAKSFYAFLRDGRVMAAQIGAPLIGPAAECLKRVYASW